MFRTLAQHTAKTPAAGARASYAMGRDTLRLPGVRGFVGRHTLSLP